MKKAHRYLTFIIVIALVVGAVIGLTIFNKNPSKNIQTNSPSNVPVNGNAIYEPIKVTKDNLPGFLQAQQLIKDMPDKGIFLLKIYNYNTGERQIEESYILTKGKVEKGTAEGADAIIYLDSKYVSYLGDFCGAMKTAKAKGELGYETGMSEVGFMWKYRGMMKYKGCFGL